MIAHRANFIFRFLLFINVIFINVENWVWGQFAGGTLSIGP